MKKTIKLLKKNSELKVIDDELDIYLEIPHIAYAEVKKKDGGKSLLFTNVVDKRNNKTATRKSEKRVLTEENIAIYHKISVKGNIRQSQFGVRHFL